MSLTVLVIWINLNSEEILRSPHVLVGDSEIAALAYPSPTLILCLSEY